MTIELMPRSRDLFILHEVLGPDNTRALPELWKDNVGNYYSCF